MAHRFSIFTQDSPDVLLNRISVEPRVVTQIQALEGSVSSIIGPSRQGKSHLCNLLVDRVDGFKVDSNPAVPCTLDASGCYTADGVDKKGLIIDSQGISSHQVTDLERKMFWALYGISDNLIYTSKDFFDDRFIAHLQELGAVSDSYEGAKPRLLLVLRDADSFDFAMEVDPRTQERRYVRVLEDNGSNNTHRTRDGGDVDMEGDDDDEERMGPRCEYVTLDEYVSHHVIPRLQELGLGIGSLFSDIRGFALPSSLKRVKTRKEAALLKEGDMKSLLACVSELAGAEEGNKVKKMKTTEDNEGGDASHPRSRRSSSSMKNMMSKINACSTGSKNSNDKDKFCFGEYEGVDQVNQALAQLFPHGLPQFPDTSPHDTTDGSPNKTSSSEQKKEAKKLRIKIAMKYAWDAEALKQDFKSQVEQVATFCAPSPKLDTLMEETRMRVFALAKFIEDKEAKAYKLVEKHLSQHPKFQTLLSPNEERRMSAITGETYARDAKRFQADYEATCEGIKSNLVPSKRITDVVDTMSARVQTLVERVTVDNLYQVVVPYAEASRNEDAQARLASKFNWDGAVLRGHFGAHVGSVFIEGVYSPKAKEIFEEYRDHVWALAGRMDRKTRKHDAFSPRSTTTFMGMGSMLASVALLGRLGIRDGRRARRVLIGYLTALFALLGGIKAVCRKLRKKSHGSSCTFSAYELGPIKKECETPFYADTKTTHMMKI